MPIPRQLTDAPWRRHSDLLTGLLATIAWIALAEPPTRIEFDPPLLRAILMGSAILLAVPPLLGRPIRWDGLLGLVRAGSMVSASYIAAWIEMVLVLQWHAALMESQALAAAGEAIPAYEELLRMRLLAGLPWIATLVIGCRHGLVATPAPDPGPAPATSSPASAELSPPGSTPSPTGSPETPDPVD